MEKQLILLTESFPFGQKETFLETEIKFLAEEFSSIHIFSLHGSGTPRTLPSHIVVHPPFLPFHLKNQFKLFTAGIFNLSPVAPLCQDFYTHQVYESSGKVRVWLAASLIFRATRANKKRFSELTDLLAPDNSILYSYWGDKLSCLIPTLKKRNPHFTSVVRFHRTDLYEEFKNGHIPFRESLFKHTDHFVFISENGQQYLQQRYPHQIGNCHLFRLGVSDHGLNPRNQSTFHLVSCSYMVPVKRIPLLIQALYLIDFPIKWTHIGTGSQRDEIDLLIKELPTNIEASLAGSLTNGQVMDFYKTVPVDLFINVSENEGVPVSIMEALSFGIPVIATNAGGSGEIVDDSVGKLLPVMTNPEEIAHAIRETAQHIQLRNTRERARERWAHDCDAEKNYKQFVHFLKFYKDR